MDERGMEGDDECSDGSVRWADDEMLQEAADDHVTMIRAVALGNGGRGKRVGEAARFSHPFSIFPMNKQPVATIELGIDRESLFPGARSEEEEEMLTLFNLRNTCS